jgi:hypothetical protein
MSLAKSNLKTELDKIDQTAVETALKGFYESRLAILNSMWEKGKLVAEYRGVDSAVTWLTLEKDTGRQRETLQKWFDLYEKYPKLDDYSEQYAKPKAEAWARKALAPPQLLSATPDEVDDWAIGDDWPIRFKDSIIEKLTHQEPDNLAEPVITKEEIARFGHMIHDCTDVKQVQLAVVVLRELSRVWAGIVLDVEARMGELLKEEREKAEQ